MVVRSFHSVTELGRWYQQEGRRRSSSPTRPSSSRTPGGRGWSGCLSPTTSRRMSGNLSRRPWRGGLRETPPLKSHCLLSLSIEMLWFCEIYSQPEFNSAVWDVHTKCTFFLRCFTVSDLTLIWYNGMSVLKCTYITYKLEILLFYWISSLSASFFKILSKINILWWCRVPNVLVTGYYRLPGWAVPHCDVYCRF